MSVPLIDVFIPTFNESSHITQAVTNASSVGRVFVLDSGSTDGTQELARQAGAEVVVHTFEGYAKQKNWGLDHIPFQGKWVLILDADERVTPALRDELLKTAQLPDAADGYYVNRLLIIMGQQVRHGGLYPSWNLRFFRRGACRYEERSVHEHMICQGRTAYLRHELLHVRTETISQYLDKHIRYADLESDEWIKHKTGRAQSARASAIFRNMLRYRQWLRRVVWPALPFRPFCRFVYMYIVRLGFLDGRAGWHLAMLMASYEYMISILYWEKRDQLKQSK